jgi:YD repeat-containing protein
MRSRLRHRLVISVVVISLIVVSFNTLYAETTNYFYDELNRLIRVEYGNGTVIEYTYDKAGNRLEKKISYSDTTPPTTTASPSGGTYNTAQPVTLACNDGTGSGCNKTYYTTDGSTPTPSSNVYTTPIAITAGTTTLNFFSTDIRANTTMKRQDCTTTTSDITTPQPADM